MSNNQVVAAGAAPVTHGAEVPPPPLPTPVVPYATPVGIGTQAHYQVVWSGRELMIPDGASIADRCVRCGDPSDGRPFKRRLSWHPGALYLLILFPGLLIYLIVAMFVRKRATIYVGLCERHRRQRRTMMAVAGGVLLAAIALFFMAANSTDDDLIRMIVPAGIAGAVTSLVMAMVISKQLGYPGRIRPPFVWLKNVHSGYPAHNDVRRESPVLITRKPQAAAQPK